MTTAATRTGSMENAAPGVASVHDAHSSMDMGGGSQCKISMTWNWYTVGACFISKAWRIPSRGIFAVSCVGIVCVVMALEFLRRLQCEFERRAFVGRRLPEKDAAAVCAAAVDAAPAGHGQEVGEAGKGAGPGCSQAKIIALPTCVTDVRVGTWDIVQLKSQVPRQLVRALLHTLVFGVAYVVMLLAMYYNGFVIISILIGAFLGSFVFGWDQARGAVGAANLEDVTGCCG